MGEKIRGGVHKSKHSCLKKSTLGCVGERPVAQHPLTHSSSSAYFFNTESKDCLGIVERHVAKKTLLIGVSSYCYFLQRQSGIQNESGAWDCYVKKKKRNGLVSDILHQLC